MKCKWSGDEVNEWSCIVSDIQTHWKAETQQKPFPKLHMLRHTVEFAQRHQLLGSVSESQIESYHASFNSLLTSNHFNIVNNAPERLRRCLADTTCCVIGILIELSRNTKEVGVDVRKEDERGTVGGHRRSLWFYSTQFDWSIVCLTFNRIEGFSTKKGENTNRRQRE